MFLKNQTIKAPEKNMGESLISKQENSNPDSKAKQPFKKTDKVNYLKMKENYYIGKPYKSDHKTNDKLEENTGNSDHTQRVTSL